MMTVCLTVCMDRLFAVFRPFLPGQDPDPSYLRLSETESDA